MRSSGPCPEYRHGSHRRGHREAAREKIAMASGSVKTAIVMILADCSLEEARARLEKSGGHVRGAIA